MKNPQDNKRNLATRRTAAEGGDTRNVASKPFIDPSEQVNDRDLLEAVCADLCRGKLGRYPIFGFGLKVEERGGNEEKFAVLVFYGTTHGHDLEDLIRPEHWISISSLFRNPKNVEWKNPSEEILTMQLWAQPEIQLTLSTVREKRRKEKYAAQEQQRQGKIAKEANRVERQQKVLAKLRTQIVPSVVTDVDVKFPVDTTATKVATRDESRKLETLGEILNAFHGSIQHDGLNITVGNGPQNKVVIRLKDIPEQHEMAELAGKNFFAKQECLFYSGDSEGAPKWEGNALLSYKLRTYLRKQLIAAGIYLLPPVPGAVAATSEDAPSVPATPTTVVSFDSKRLGSAHQITEEATVASAG